MFQKRQVILQCMSLGWRDICDKQYNFIEYYSDPRASSEKTIENSAQYPLKWRPWCTYIIYRSELSRHTVLIRQRCMSLPMFQPALGHQPLPCWSRAYFPQILKITNQNSQEFGGMSKFNNLGLSIIVVTSPAISIFLHFHRNADFLQSGYLIRSDNSTVQTLAGIQPRSPTGISHSAHKRI